MSNGKYLVRIDGDGDVLDRGDWHVHGGSDAQGDGYACGLKDDYFESDYPELNGLPTYEETTKPISCDQCIRVMEMASGYKKRNGKWY